MVNYHARPIGIATATKTNGKRGRDKRRPAADDDGRQKRREKPTTSQSKPPPPRLLPLASSPPFPHNFATENPIPALTTSTNEIGFKQRIVAPHLNHQHKNKYHRQNGMMRMPKDRGPCTRVELLLSAKSLADRDVFSKSDPICVVEELVQRGTAQNVQNIYVEVGRTERIKNSLNPKWSRKISVNYHFESKQLLRFNLYDIDSDSAQLNDHDFLGRGECELADIVAAPDGALQLRVKYFRDLPNQSGELTVCAEEVDEGQRESVQFVCHGISLKPSSSSPICAALFGGGKHTFLEFYRQMDSGSRQMAYRTGDAKGMNHPEWKPFELNVRHLCGGDKDREFTIECYEKRESSGNHQFIGALHTTVNALLTAPKGHRMNLIKKSKNGREKAKGTIHFLEVRIQQEYTFLDYITRGMQLEFAVSVDLTASNGEVSKSSSLHYVNSAYLNQYECASVSPLAI